MPDEEIIETTLSEETDPIIITKIQLSDGTTGDIGVNADNIIIDTGEGTSTTFSENITTSFNAVKVIKNINIETSSWIDTSLEISFHSEFPYQCIIDLQDINNINSNENTFAKIIFDPIDAASGNFASVCETTEDNEIIIYARTVP